MMRATSFAIALSISALGARAFAQDVSPPDALVKNVTLGVLETIAKDKDIQAGDRRKTIDLIERKVLPHFNFSGMTALALGASWRRASRRAKRAVDRRVQDAAGAHLRERPRLLPGAEVRVPPPARKGGESPAWVGFLYTTTYRHPRGFPAYRIWPPLSLLEGTFSRRHTCRALLPAR